MRSLRLFVVAVAVVLAAPTATAQPSLLGIEMGTMLGEATDTLAARGCTSIEQNDLEGYSYATDCTMGGTEVTVAADMDGYPSRGEAPVDEVIVSAYEGEVGMSTVVEVRDLYLKRFRETFGEPDRSETDIITTWRWQTDDTRAEVEFQTDTQGNPNTVSVLLQSAD